MTYIFHPLLALIASAADRELAKYIQFLKEENKILRARVPGVIHTRPEERERLIKFGKAVGRAIEELLTIVRPRQRGHSSSVAGEEFGGCGFIQKELKMSRHRHELTDAKWEKIKDLLPGKQGDPGQTGVDNRLFVDAVVFILKTGIPWADLPERFGNWNSIWRRYDRWCEKGVLEALSQALSDPDLSELHLDSSSIKAHPVAATGRRRGGKKMKRPMPEDAWDAAGED